MQIAPGSPLWEMSPTDILSAQFEIIVTIEGTTPETGNTIQVPTREEGVYLEWQCYTPFHFAGQSL